MRVLTDREALQPTSATVVCSDCDGTGLADRPHRRMHGQHPDDICLECNGRGEVLA